MSIFRRKSHKTSNDYYNSYKAELGVDKSEGLFSLKNIIKLETATIIAGLIFMGYSNFFSDFSENFSIEFNSNIFTSQVSLPESNNFDESDSELIVQLQNSEPDEIEPVKIMEEEKSKKEPVEMLAKKLNMNFADLSLIVEIIKSEMTPKSTSNNEDSIVIGQL
jgi:hypothetical protein